MHKEQYDILDELEELDHLPAIRNLPIQRQHSRHKAYAKPKKPRSGSNILAELAEQADDQGSFDFSYNASRHERQWIIDSLGGFYEGQWLEDILRLLKGGKEASVYQALVNPSVSLPSPYIAAKVYRPRRFRNLKNDHLYREGRDRLDEDGIQIIDDRTLHAISQRTDYGRRVMHTSWIEHEYQTMQILHAAGADIPVPYTRGNNAILMEYIGGPDMPAPTLNTVKLDRQEAGTLFERVLHNVDLMLANERIHGDLSAYNILYWNGEIKLIDFPQAINPNQNRSAYLIFKRDIRRLVEYFQRQGVKARPNRVAQDLWTSHGHRIQHAPNPALLDDQDEDDLRHWQRYTHSD